ncbi:hypothetical protein DPMN_090549 [Dreissena polymorpha]|uniref:Uncharacterized protein n=1 Tax=Dreissena polymorpha TaxID=45954 RepID=A0A9D4QZW0_DREPO|nr:hypothetical protein DPMN_090549 [Dreissena polymorpha]
MAPYVCQFGNLGWTRGTIFRQFAVYRFRRWFQGAVQNDKDGGVLWLTWSVVCDLPEAREGECADRDGTPRKNIHLN